MLLVFAKRDSQCIALSRAADLGRYVCHAAPTADAAIHLYEEHRHQVVIVDSRPKRGFEAEGFARQIRAVAGSEYSVLVAVRPTNVSEKEDQSVLPLLRAGFSRQFVENVNVNACLSELRWIEHGEARAQVRLVAAQAAFVAVEHSTDAVEITNENHEIQYVNSVFEKMLGYSEDELVGKNFQDISRSDRTKGDGLEAINDQLRNGKPWHGSYHIRRKNGEDVPHRCSTFPVFGAVGKICHFVTIRNPLLENSSTSDQANGCSNQSPVPEAISRRCRIESSSKVHSMTIEAPITKAISMISSLQETCPVTIVRSLDRVLEVLRSSELYSPYFTQQVRNDKMTSELVGGLMKMDEDFWAQKKVSSTKRLSCSSEHHCLMRSHSRMSGLTSSGDVEMVLDAEDQWDFDIIQLEKLTEKRPLVHLAMRTFQRYEVLDFLQVDEALMCSWLQMIEANYHGNNPYHNSTHAADVMHATSYFLACDVIKSTFDQSDEVASLIAAVVHDLGHPGKTNSYLVNSSNELAVLYNDLAVLESHHVSLAYSLTLKNDSLNVFRNLSRDSYRTLRQQIVDMVLATEMTKHFEHLNRFVSVISQPPVDENKDPSSSQRLLHEATAKLSTAENRILIRRMLIKCADVSNPARPLQLCIEWATRIADEYCQQTDDEKVQGLPIVMPLFDRKLCNVPKSQISFMDFFIRDMFEAWSKFCSLPEMLNHISDNYKYWKECESSAGEHQSPNDQD